MEVAPKYDAGSLSSNKCTNWGKGVVHGRNRGQAGAEKWLLRVRLARSGCKVGDRRSGLVNSIAG